MIKNKIHCLLLILVLYNCTSMCTSTKSRLKQYNPIISYSPSQVANLIPNYSETIDPMNYINSTTAHTNLTNVYNKLMLYNNFTAYIIFIPSMTPNYTDVELSGSSSFVGELANILKNTNNKIDYDSIIILMSIEDQLVQLRTGADVRAIIPDALVQGCIDAIKPQLYVKDYAGAATQLANLLINEISIQNFGIIGHYLGATSLSNANLMIIIIVVVIAAAAIIAGLLIYFLCVSLGSDLETRLKRVKSVTSTEDNAFQYLHENCTICIENLRDRAALSNKLLICGHAYHNNCLTVYSRSRSNCPNCEFFFNIRSTTETGNTTFQKALIRVQEIMFLKQINKYEFNYRYGNFGFTKNSNNSSNENSVNLPVEKSSGITADKTYSRNEESNAKN